MTAAATLARLAARAQLAARGPTSPAAVRTTKAARVALAMRKLVKPETLREACRARVTWSEAPRGDDDPWRRRRTTLALGHDEESMDVRRCHLLRHDHQLRAVCCFRSVGARFATSSREPIVVP